MIGSHVDKTRPDEGGFFYGHDSMRSLNRSRASSLAASDCVLRFEVDRSDSNSNRIRRSWLLLEEFLRSQY